MDKLALIFPDATCIYYPLSPNTSVDDIYRFAQKKAGSRIQLIIQETIVPQNTLELWVQYKKRMEFTGLARMFVEVRSSSEVTLDSTETKVDSVVVGLDGVPLYLSMSVILPLGPNTGSSIFAIFDGYFDGFFTENLDILTVALRNPGVAKVLRVYDTGVMYDIGEHSQFFVVTDPKPKHAGGRRRAKSTSGHGLSRNYSH